jgi:DMSO/TMAO reductase YedYZ molybdopterin-dependent catalytic subunit
LHRKDRASARPSTPWSISNLGGTIKALPFGPSLQGKEFAMLSRRRFASNMFRACAGVFLGLGGFMQKAWAETKRRLLPKGTSALSLRNRNPKLIDASQLEITPLDKFGTMGLTNYKVDMESWRLEVGGKVKRPLKLTYSQVLKLPMVERKELLICPGVFSYQALYQGVMLKILLKKTGLEQGARKVVIGGPKGGRLKEESFSMDEIEAGRVLLAWSVNGVALPKKHGYPLRVVAPDRYGDDWVKYVSKIEVK